MMAPIKPIILFGLRDKLPNVIIGSLVTFVTLCGVGYIFATMATSSSKGFHVTKFERGSKAAAVILSMSIGVTAAIAATFGPLAIQGGVVDRVALGLLLVFGLSGLLLMSLPLPRSAYTPEREVARADFSSRIKWARMFSGFTTLGAGAYLFFQK